MVKMNLISILLVIVMFCGLVNTENKNDDDQEVFPFKTLESAVRSIGLKIFFDFSQCGVDMKKVYKGLKSRELWALKMLDSTSKLPPAVLEGNIIGLGSSDECLDVLPTPKYGNFIGKYCSAFLPIPETISKRFNVDPHYLKKISMRWGVCVPSSCRDADLNYYVSPLTSTYNFTINFSDDRCYTKEGLPYTRLDLISLATFVLVILLIISSTTYEKFINKHGRKPISEIFTAFSITTNFKELFKVKSTSNRNIIYSLVGMRVLSLAWVISAHLCLILLSSPVLNMKTILERSRSLSGQLLLCSMYAVDTFFVLSGFLVAYILQKKIKNVMKLTNILKIYIHRYIRLTPPYAAMILFQTSLAKHLYQGPMWNDVWQFWCGGCSKYWWAALTYIQNYVNPGNFCLGQTWYLSVDMQLFLIAPFLLILFHKYRRSTFPVLTLLNIVSISATFVIAIIYEIPAGLTKPKLDLRQNLLYVQTYSRASPWLIGLGFGYFFYHNKGKMIAIPKAIVTTCWILTFAIMGALFVGMWFLIQVDYVYNPFVDSFYLAFSRTFWGFVIVWIIFACENGYAGFINDLLAWKWFQPLARLTYSHYLVHSSYQRMMAGGLKTTKYSNVFYSFTNFVSDYIMTLIFAVFLYLLIEAPFAKIEKLCLGDEGDVEKRPESLKQPNNKQV